MQGKRLFIDANILVRAVLGIRVRELDRALLRVGRVLRCRVECRGGDAVLGRTGAATRHPGGGMAAVAGWNHGGRADYSAGRTRRGRAEAMARIGKRDAADWPAVAGALQFDCPVWTEDEDFFGSGIATWTTATVEIFLRGE